MKQMVNAIKVNDIVKTMKAFHTRKKKGNDKL